MSKDSWLGNFFKKALPKIKLPARFALPVAATTTVFIIACGEKNSDVQNASNAKEKESITELYALPFPKGETWYLTNGPHGDGYSKGVKYGIDIAPPELGRLNGNCPADGSRLSIDNRVITASASEEVIVKGDDKNRNDPYHSEIRIKDKNGLTQVYIHLDNTKVKLGDKVKQGDPLGNPSCEFPPGGRNTGPHVHIGLMKDGQLIPIDGVEIGGWTIHEGINGQEGTMTKPGEKTRTANTGRLGENSTGIRNDLPNNSNKSLVAEPKDFITPISGNIIEKPESTNVATPTSVLPNSPRKPSPTIEKSGSSEKRISISKKPDELYKTLLTAPFQNSLLPAGVTFKEKMIGGLHPTAETFKAIGTVNILLLDENVGTYLNDSNSNISYVIFPNAANAKSMYDAMTSSTNDEKELKYVYPTFILTESDVGTTDVLIAMQVENVLVVTHLFQVGTEADPVGTEKETLRLAGVALQYLAKVGN